VEARNITFNLPADLIRQAKIYAAEHDTTINALVRELLREKLSPDKRARSAAKRLLELAQSGALHSTVNPGSIPREELYERR
jgi:plasmid stability protein